MCKNQSPISRTSLLIGPSAVRRLSSSRVALFGLGGVGGHAAEALARAGIGDLLLVDPDIVEPPDLNRQIAALHSTLGRHKADVMAERIRDINPAADVRPLRLRYLPENADALDLSGFDCIADAVDTVAAKVELAVRARALGIPIVSCMGAGNRLDPSRFRVADLFETSGCPLCRAMRRALRRRGFPAGLTVVYSDEPPLKLPGPAIGTISFVPPAAGLLLASAVIQKLLLPRPPCPCRKRQS